MNKKIIDNTEIKKENNNIYIENNINSNIENKKKNKNKKIIYISSMGGHLKELLMLEKLFDKYDTTIITEKTDATKNLKEDILKKHKNTKTYYLEYGTKHNIFPYIGIFLKNIFLSFKYFKKVMPDIVITTGTHTAVPMCFIAKIFNKKVIYIETFASVTGGSLAGKIVYPIADEFIVQWKEMLKKYPNAKYLGGIF